MAKKKIKAKLTKSALKKKRSSPKDRSIGKKKSARDTYTHSDTHWNRSEEVLVQDLDEELKDAWLKLKEYALSLGEQRCYASGRAIMFSRSVCYCFVRPKTKYLETVVFLKSDVRENSFHSVKSVSKTKNAHTFRLVHADQVEGELADAVTQAYAETPVDKA